MFLHDIVLEVAHLAFADGRVIHLLEEHEPEGVQDEEAGDQNPTNRHVRLKVGPVLCIPQVDQEVDDQRQGHQAHG